MELEQIVSNILEQMKAVGDQWIMPWHGTHKKPLNVSSGRGYTGINRIILWSQSTKHDYHSRFWGTFSQWRKIRQPVEKGQKGTPAFRPIIRRKKGKQALSGFYTYYLFNGDQVVNRNENHPDLFGDCVELPPQVEDFITSTKADIRIGRKKAYYSPKGDFIKVPPVDSFFATSASTKLQNYYSTVLHELTHWTGHPKRKNRVGQFETDRENYAFEELVAELGAAFLCSEFEIEDVPRPDHAQYLNSWIKIMDDDMAQLWRAASQAQHAVDYLMNTESIEPESDNSSPGRSQKRPRKIMMTEPLFLE